MEKKRKMLFVLFFKLIIIYKYTMKKKDTNWGECWKRGEKKVMKDSSILLTQLYMLTFKPQGSG